MPLAGRGRARTQPIWADDVADCVIAALDAARAIGAARPLRARRPRRLTHREFVELALRAARRAGALMPVPAPVLRPLLRAYETLAGPAASPPGTRRSCSP